MRRFRAITSAAIPTRILNRVLRTGCEMAAVLTEHLPLEQRCAELPPRSGHADRLRVLRPEDL